MQINNGRTVRVEIAGVVDGEGVIVDGVLAFRANRTGGRVEGVGAALIDGVPTPIAAPVLNKRAGAFEARVLA